MLTNLIFYPVFLLQIILISWYVPAKIAKRYSIVLNKYPETEYPKLYPLGREYIDSKLRTFISISNMNLIIGGIVFGLVAYWDYHHEGKISEAIPAAYFFLQVLAIVYLELVVFRQLKVMRMSNKSSVKTADLSPRRVIDYIPQSLLVLCAVLYLGFLAAVFFRYGINFTDKVIINILAITLMNVFFFLVLDHFSKGKKLDPHQSKNDKNRQISVLARGLVLVSCLSSGFLILTLSTHVFGVSQILATINSAFFQISLLLFMKPSLDALDLSQTDFSVYKK